MLSAIFYGGAVICFLCATVKLTEKINLEAFGLMLLTIGFMLGKVHNT